MFFPVPIPKAGQRLQHPPWVGSGDAFAFAELAQAHRPIIIFTALASDARRLQDEIRWFAPQLNVQFLPDWETLPYDHFSPHQDLISERLATLFYISAGQCDIALIPISSALVRLPPRNYLGAYTFFLKQGQALDLEGMRQQLVSSGYHAVSQVFSPGEYSIRGGLIDLFPMGSTLPYRIDLFDNEIESLRTFDVDTQRSVYSVTEIRLLPAREFPLDEAGVAQFRQNFRGAFEGDPTKRPLYKDVSNGLAPAGIEYYLPLFFEQTADIFDYFPQNSLLCLYGDIASATQSFWQDANQRYRLQNTDSQRPILPPTDLFLTVDQLFGRIKPYARYDFTAQNLLAPSDLSQPILSQSHTNSDTVAFQTLPDLAVDRRAEDPLYKLRQFQTQFQGTVCILAESLGRRETIVQYFSEHNLTLTVRDDYASCLNAASEPTASDCLIAVSPLTHGFIVTAKAQHAIAWVTEAELYASTVRVRQRQRSRPNQLDNLLRDLSEVKIGDPVVHVDHGVGRYLGLCNMDLGEGEQEFLQLEYAGNDKLYVPVAQLHCIGRYSGVASDSVHLSKLGSGQWEKAKRRAMEQAHDTAAELLDLYARRAARVGHAFSFNASDYEAFVAGFGFEETPDQAAAIDAVIQDMRSSRPMDRLVCGDVGFGKTEVALRATFVALMAGMQVVILVPTTLLAEQHTQTFMDRFAQWPVRIAELSRFRSAKEQAITLRELAEGKVDIVIGTHRLLQNDVAYKQLGLVIIDEEHRFGVRQKEQMKRMRAEVDVLTLTATPIPRTLGMALEGIRDFSTITTPPQKRLSIKTFVASYSSGIIREAVLRELKRGGQIYFLHNAVNTIRNMESILAELLPEARIRVAHGQMPERELEQVMRLFHQQQINVLLCTTIIETGLDIPTANTIIINRADNFGLAQLHQLRGRVGRSHHQAYAYLLIPEDAALSSAAKKRLEALQLMEDLGAGFHLAMHDLEIRGAGEILGESQSGSMQEIGFSLYNDMLNHAVKALKRGETPNLDQPLEIVTDINLHVPTLLPTMYCGDVHERLVLYKRLANCVDTTALDDLQEELVDRFGVLPNPTAALFETHRLRLLAKPLGVLRLDATNESVVIQFIPKPPIDPMHLMQLIHNNRHYQLAGPDKLRIKHTHETWQDRVKLVKSIFKELT